MKSDPAHRLPVDGAQSRARTRRRHRPCDLFRIPCWSCQPGALMAKGFRGSPGRGLVTMTRSGSRIGRAYWCLRLTRAGWAVELSYAIDGVPVVQALHMQADTVAGTKRRRWWWTCEKCGRRCAVVCLSPVSGRFGCRACL